MNLVNSKITGTPYLVRNEEKDERQIFFKLISYALMSQPAVNKITPRIKVGNKIYLLGKNIHHFAMRMMEIDSDKVILNGHTIKSVYLWKLIKHYFDQLYGLAQAEAIAKSKEMPKIEQSSKAFGFSSDGEKTER